jgi:hypothetical protein
MDELLDSNIGRRLAEAGLAEHVLERLQPPPL